MLYMYLLSDSIQKGNSLIENFNDNSSHLEAAYLWLNLNYIIAFELKIGNSNEIIPIDFHLNQFKRMEHIFHISYQWKLFYIFLFRFTDFSIESLKIT